jgi:hypothetical protein
MIRNCKKICCFLFNEGCLFGCPIASFFYVQAGLHDSFYGVVGGATLSFDDHYLVCCHTLFFFFFSFEHGEATFSSDSPC